MTTVVTITTTAPVCVIVEAIKEEGRERYPNGQTDMAADESHSFIVHATQSLRIVEASA